MKYWLVACLLANVAGHNCPSGKYNNSTDHSGGVCIDYSLCPPGSGVSVNGTHIADTQCASCLPGTYNSVNDSFSPCQTFSAVCPAGEYTSAGATDSSNRVCTACPAGHHKALDSNGVTNPDTCTASTSVCSGGKHITHASTSSADATCANCNAGTAFPDANSHGTNTTGTPGCTYLNSLLDSLLDSSGVFTVTQRTDCTSTDNCGVLTFTVPDGPSGDWQPNSNWSSVIINNTGQTARMFTADTCRSGTTVQDTVIVAYQVDLTNGHCFVVGHNDDHGDNMQNCNTPSSHAAKAQGRVDNGNMLFVFAMPYNANAAGTIHLDVDVPSAGSAYSCPSCRHGKYAGTAGATSCTDCSAGQYTHGFYTASCKPCSAGQYNTGSGKSSCEQCPVGKYGAATALTSCTACTVCTWPDGNNDCGAAGATAAGSCETCGSTPANYIANSTAGHELCSPTTVCKVHQYESTAPAASSDRQCSALTTCTNLQYESAAPTATSNRQCVDLNLECAPGQYIPSHSTPGADCAACPAGTFWPPEKGDMINDVAACANLVNLLGNAQECTQDNNGKCSITLSVQSNSPTRANVPTSSSGLYKYTHSGSAAEVFTAGTCGHDTHFDTVLTVYEIDSNGNGNCSLVATNDDLYQAAHDPGYCPEVNGVHTHLPSEVYNVVEPGTVLLFVVQPYAEFQASSTGTAPTHHAHLEIDFVKAKTEKYTCNKCAAGKSQPLAGNSTCTECAAGQVQPLMGDTSCVQCAAGKYQSNTGQTVCTACPAHHYSLAGASVCTAHLICPTGQYRKDSHSGAAGTCTSLTTCDSTCGITLNTSDTSAPAQYTPTSSVTIGGTPGHLIWSVDANVQLNQCRSPYSIAPPPTPAYIDHWNLPDGTSANISNFPDATSYHLTLDINAANMTTYYCSNLQCSQTSNRTAPGLHWKLDHWANGASSPTFTSLGGTASNSDIDGMCVLHVALRSSTPVPYGYRPTTAQASVPEFHSGVTELMAYHANVPCADVTNGTTLEPILWSHQYESKAPTNYTDRECMPVRSNCPSTQFAATASTGTSDTGCQKHTTCGSTQWQTFAGNATDDRECRDWTTCTDGATYESTAPTAMSDRVCSACTECDYATQYRSTPCSKLHNTTCKALTTCAQGYHQVAAPTATSDRVCSPVTTNCKPHQYRLPDVPGNPNAICKAFTICTSTQWQSKAPTTSSDRHCNSLTPCAASSEWMSKNYTLTSNRECKVLTTCNSAKHEIESQSTDYNEHCKCNTRDRKCTQCGKTMAPGDLDLCTHLTSATVGQTYYDILTKALKNVTHVPAGYYIVEAATHVSNVYYEPCLAGTYSDHANAASCTKLPSCSGIEEQKSTGAGNTKSDCKVNAGIAVGIAVGLAFAAFAVWELTLRKNRGQTKSKGLTSPGARFPGNLAPRRLALPPRYAQVGELQMV